MNCLFVADLQGKIGHYQKLLQALVVAKPQALFLGGDLTPSGIMVLVSKNNSYEHFTREYLIPYFSDLRRRLGEKYPRIFLILGNDDARIEEGALHEAQNEGFIEYIHDRRVMLDNHPVYGYAFIPPSPFQLKDWERYDVSRYVDPGCLSPERGLRSVPVSEREIRHATIAADLAHLAGDDSLDKAIFLFHSPPYRTNLDRADLDGRMVDHVPLDVHIGSIAIKEFIKTKQPLLTLHGHVHESARLTGSWKDKIGRTCCLSAAHDGPELALVYFNPEKPQKARRELV